MSGEKSISALLRGMSPILNEGDFVFCTVAHTTVLQGTEVLGTFREKEGLTAIIERERADALGLEYSFVAAWITLTIHSALDAVGLTAAFATALGNAGISCNVIAAFYHDHIFVAKDDAAKAMDVLQALSRAGESS
ncbi:ACT domain-containing protein [Pseudomonas sichuanensis]|uniref:ACT domain-containing protein n=1 Tax=Pseudomonas sichuanensis TaxID=2213015 RepID=UPI0024496B01|nr:ACT domain-containing protein [Pseudomonas sichuanensis]MDH0733740.1 ACT domain-containing protein [Pseudomonas sichuanensis]MDH1585765.1 ACT domain-containing protein [Pseudomonas sichuanensis]MDH1595471.1 ACT domain-containing protein [Pseudomonas sichuanensis]MDH1600798.1 ACT domain-containing protein [Pseudomonas sichuanensis]